MKKKILIDARMVGPIMHGIARYVLDILGGIHRYYPPTSRKYDLEVLINPKEFPNEWIGTIPWKIHKSKVPFLSKAELFQLPKDILASQATFFHTPSFSSLLKYPRPHLQTLHDLNHLHFGSFAKKVYYKNIVRPSASTAISLMTVSEASKKEIQDWLKPKNDIAVVDNAIYFDSASEDHPKLKERNIAPKRYFLCVSNSKLHKNLGTLCEAYQHYRSRSASPWPLILTSKEPTLDSDGILQLGGVAPKHITSLIQNCKAFFFPSKYEGFGRPPVEAFCLGVPVFTSDIPPHRESLGEYQQGIKFLDPNNLNFWVEAFIDSESNLDTPNLDDRDAVYSRYSLEELARKIHAVYESL